MHASAGTVVSRACLMRSKTRWIFLICKNACYGKIVALKEHIFKSWFGKGSLLPFKCPIEGILIFSKKIIPIPQCKFIGQ